MERLQITTLAAQDISAPLLAATYTADQDREILVQLYLSGLDGGGAYRACLTKQLNGAGSAYQSETSIVALAAAVTTGYIPTIPLPVRTGDVVKVYAQGLAADTSVAVVTEVFDTLILDHLQAIMRSDATLPSDVGGTYTPVLHSLEALRNTLVRSSVQGAAGVNDLTIVRGDSYNSDDDNPIVGLGDITGRTKLWITGKRSKSQLDSEAIFQIEETDGLTVVNGAPYGTPAHGSITVSDEATGNLYFKLDEAVTDDFDPAKIVWDVQVLNAGDVTTLRDAALAVTADVTRAIV